LGPDNPPNAQWLEVDRAAGLAHYAHQCCLEKLEAEYRATDLNLWPTIFVHGRDLRDLQLTTGVRLGSARTDVEHVYGKGQPIESRDGAVMLRYIYRLPDISGCNSVTSFVLRSDQVVAIEQDSGC